MRANKFNSIKTVVNGIKFASKGEAARYQALRLMERTGAISNLRLQAEFILAPSVVINGRKQPARKYIADFIYIEHGTEIVEDFKGVRTPVYILKRHLMKSLHNIDIRETGSRK